uniref:Beta-1,4-galactosyltransferase n=1 Tax=Parastrongyloides trichosuri TaxID=131310 RepID=A0A0N4ZI45_PARTI
MKIKKRAFTCIVLLLALGLFLSYIFYNGPKIITNYIYYNSDIKYNYKFNYPESNLSDCSYKQQNNLQGKYLINFSVPSIDYIEKVHSNINYGGHYYPKHCKVKQKVAILVPYKNREDELKIFLYNYHKILPRQYINYIIFLIEPINNDNFNRGKLLNAGFLEVLKLYSFDCVIFHDIDILPENDNQIYECSSQPRHMATFVKNSDYMLKNKETLTGAFAFTVEHFKKVNGFNNNDWKWGLEDVDLTHRTRNSGLSIVRYPKEISTYSMKPHFQHDFENLDKCNLRISNFIYQTFKNDGLNTLEYKLKEVNYHKLFTKIYVDLFGEASKKKLVEMIKEKDLYLFNFPNLSFIFTANYEIKKRTKIFCFMVTSKQNMKTRAIYQKETWPTRCDNFIYASAEDDPFLPALNVCSYDSYSSLWCKVKGITKYIWKKYGNEYDWYFKADDDTYIILENLRALLSILDPNKHIFYGHKMFFLDKFNKRIVLYLHGGSGYLMSRESMKALVEKGYNNLKYCALRVLVNEDVEVGDCFDRLDINITDVLDYKGRTPFIPINPIQIIAPFKNKKISTHKYSITKMVQGINSISDFPMTFHYVTKEMMYALEYLVYKANVIGRDSRIDKMANYKKEDIKNEIIHKYELIKKFSKHYFIN